jgi:hypothetical protein
MTLRSPEGKSEDDQQHRREEDELEVDTPMVCVQSPRHEIGHMHEGMKDVEEGGAEERTAPRKGLRRGPAPARRAGLGGFGFASCETEHAHSGNRLETILDSDSH